MMTIRGETRGTCPGDELRATLAAQDIAAFEAVESGASALIVGNSGYHAGKVGPRCTGRGLSPMDIPSSPV